MIHHPPTLASAMTPFPYSIALDAPLDEADRLMKEHGIHHLPVTENHDVVGIITQRDMAAAFARRKARGRSTNKMSVSDLYVPEVYLVDLNEPIQNVLRVMAERHIGRRLPLLCRFHRGRLSRSGRRSRRLTAGTAIPPLGRRAGRYIRRA
jgi:CBS domain-containing protein